MNMVIQSKNLCKDYGKSASVDHINLAVPQGSIYGFLGPNGAGKSTTMKMLLGLVKPTNGEIFMFGKQLNEKNRLHILRHVGSLIESPSHYGHLTGYENLNVIATIRGVSKSEIEHVLRTVRLQKQKNKKVFQYSLGMKQRLGIAIALLGSPELLILDEPTNGLDPAGIQEMRELIISLPKQQGMSIMISSHLLSEVDQMADTLGIINNGKLIFQDTLTKLHKQQSANFALRTTDNSKALQMLVRYQIQAEHREEYLMLPPMNDDCIAQLSLFLAKEQIGILRLEKKEHSLEELFLHLTGKEPSL